MRVKPLNAYAQPGHEPSARAARELAHEEEHGQAGRDEGEERARVVGEHGIARDPEDGRDRDGLRQQVIAESQAVGPGVEAVRLEQGPGPPDELVRVPRHHVGEVGRIAGVGEHGSGGGRHRPHPQESQRRVGEQHQEPHGASWNPVDQSLRTSKSPMISWPALVSRMHARRVGFWALWGAFALAGTWLRLVQFFAARSLWLDESMLALNVASRSFRDLLRPLDYNQVAPPLFLWLGRLSIDLAGTNEMALRAWPMLAGLSVPLLLVARRLSAPGPGRRPHRDRARERVPYARLLRERGQALRQRRLRDRGRTRGHAGRSGPAGVAVALDAARRLRSAGASALHPGRVRPSGGAGRAGPGFGSARAAPVAGRVRPRLGRDPRPSLSRDLRGVRPQSTAAAGLRAGLPVSGRGIRGTRAGSPCAARSGRRWPGSARTSRAFPMGRSS